MDEIFSKHNVIIAHCLTANGGAGNPFSTGKNIYERIDNVIAGQLELSCSTISEKDTLRYLHQTNFFGPVGIILKATNVTYVNSHDGGTIVLQSGTRDYTTDSSNKPTAANIEKAILNRPANSYNEICIKQYIVFGLFLCFDDKQHLIANIGSEVLFHQHTSKYKLPYFNLSNGVLYSSLFDPQTNKFHANGSFTNQEIYI